MAVIVQKYGGSSVADPARIASVARRVAESAAGHQVVVVVSAMGRTTDGLVALASEITSTPDPREMDMLLATGEQVTIALLAMALHGLGRRARSFTGPQTGMRTDAAHTRARLTRIDASRVRAALDAGEIAVVAGFQGLSEGDEITTFGRGGSDLTAVALAAALKADVCEIYTDVDGVYTADPNVVPDARKLGRVSYEEMLELASLGAKVLQSRSVEFAKKYGVPVHVRSAFKSDPGTLVTREEQAMEEMVVTGVTHDRNQAKISILRVPDRPGIAGQVFGAIAERNIVVDMIVQNISRDGYTDMSFTVPRGDHARAVAALEDVARKVGAQGVSHDERVAKVSIVGVGMRSHSGVAGRMFGALAKEGINIQMISTSEIAISCVIEDKYAELAVRALHDVFEVGKGAPS
ncbi:MAG: aspartate kinase [Candidatus Rokubacteria bacterium]|nr:aspartate kinase [Candidatus Rokubacteria bacterium]MBI3825302.1 aspartate kinase [Candidatus Rokubacteria bacterium]